MATKKYTSDDIRMFSGLDKVRQFPSMYIGDTADTGLYLILRETKDNVVDEVTAGRATTLKYVIPTKANEPYWVLDDGAGVPQGIKKVPVEVSGKTVISKMPTMQAVFGELHTSGKHSEAYGASIGVHGVGAKGTNALSKSFEVWTNYKGTWHYISFAKGKLTSKGVIEQAPPKDAPFGKIKKGTLIKFVPDTGIFTAKKFAESMALDWSEITAYLNPGIRISHTYGKNTQEFYSERGPLDYLEKLVERHKCARLTEDTVNLNIDVPGMELGDGTTLTPASAVVVMCFTDYDGFGLQGFSNGLRNSDGGVHVTGVTQGLLRAVKDYAKRGQVFTGHELREGLVGIVNARLQGARFSSQAKVKLTDERFAQQFEDKIYEALKKLFAKNKALAQMICERATRLNKLKNEFKASKQVLKEINKTKRMGLPVKYAGYTNPRTPVADRELFLVEGDSAAGTLKKIRLPHQAVLPLKGKITNAMRAKDALASEEVINILVAIGFDPKASDPYEKLQVGKIICMSDPDPDGPLVGSTQVQVKIDGAPWVGPIEELVGTQGIKVQSVVYSNGRHSLSHCNANVIQVGVTQELINTEVVMEDGSKVKYQAAPSHMWPVMHYKAQDVREGIATVNEKNGMGFKRAEHLKPGDFIVHVDSPKGARVSKTKRMKLKEAVPVYCFNVPQTGNFVLPSGVVSSNCHINTLLLTLFYKYLPGLFERGLIYVIDAPEFYAEHKGKVVSGDKLSEVQEKLAKLGAKNTAIRHIKGWGEVDPDPLAEFCVHDTRRLLKMQLDPNTDADFEQLMNDNVEYRRQLMGIDK